MKYVSRRFAIAGGFAAVACGCAMPGLTDETGAPYICPPCGCAADGKAFAKPGKCPACGMTLISKPAQPGKIPFEPDALQSGSGVFETSGGIAHPMARIQVHYYKPETFTPKSPVLIVIPGAGRNGDTYRDAWIKDADRAGVLVAALSYPEKNYDFAAYQMGGVIRNLEIRNLPTGPDGKPLPSVHLRDEDISFDVNQRSQDWLFNDFDRVFTQLKKMTGSERDRYDIFGHSAGGQILHRFALFLPASRADRIVAANAGLYTLPDRTAAQPIGLKDTGITPDGLKAALGKNLIVMLGENDSDGEEGGLQLHTPLIDQQGIDRLSRGRYFFKSAQQAARNLKVETRWILQIVPKVGHDYRAMSRAAAKTLYG